MIRKFFNADEPGAGGGTPSIAALLAQHGTLNETGNMVATPIDIPAEPKPNEDAPAATATADPDKPSDTPGTQEPVKVDASVAEPQKAAEPIQQQSWQEVLKSQQPDAVLKELGYDEKLVSLIDQMKELDPKVLAFIQAYKEGRHTEYLAEWTTDYNKMTAEEVMRHQLKREYPKASPQQLEALYKREVVRAYSLDSVDDEEKEEGLALLEAKADKYREGFINEQQTKLLPKAPEAPDNSQAEAQAKAEELRRIEAYVKVVENNDYFKNISSNGKFVFGEGDEQFNFPVNASELKDTLLSDEKWQSNLYEKRSDGTLDYSKPKPEYYLTGMVAKYGFDFIKEIAKHFKSLGGEKVIAPIVNANKPDAGTPSPSEKAPTSPAEAMARQGRLVG